MNEQEQKEYKENIPVVPPLKSQEEYEQVLKRLDAGEIIIMQNGGFNSEDPKVKQWVEVYDRLALQALNWQIEHDLLSNL